MARHTMIDQSSFRYKHFNILMLSTLREFAGARINPAACRTLRHVTATMTMLSMLHVINVINSTTVQVLTPLHCMP